MDLPICVLALVKKGGHAPRHNTRRTASGTPSRASTWRCGTLGLEYDKDIPAYTERALVLGQIPATMDGT